MESTWRKRCRAATARRHEQGISVLADLDTLLTALYVGLSGEDFEDFLPGPDLGLILVRPARKDEKKPRRFPNWLRQRVEAIAAPVKRSLIAYDH